MIRIILPFSMVKLKYKVGGGQMRRRHAPWWVFVMVFIMAYLMIEWYTK